MNDKKYCINCAFFKKSFANHECWHPTNLSLVDRTPKRTPIYLREAEGIDDECGREGKWFKQRDEEPKTETSPYNPNFTPQDTKEINKKVWWHFWRA